MKHSTGVSTDTGATDIARSQTVRAQLELRQMILSGELVPGSRIAELNLVEQLAASRTPVRMALVRLEAEGLVEALPGGGFSVRAFTEQDVHDAIEIRGTLEGLSARLAAERGVSGGALARTRRLLGEIDQLLTQTALDEDSFSAYVEFNARFHSQLLAMAESPVLRRQVERVEQLPFASASAFVRVQSQGAHARNTLLIAQHQHRAVIDAIDRREGSRAESLMREHARIAHDNLQLAVHNRQALDLLPGGPLLRVAARN